MSTVDVTADLEGESTDSDERTLLGRIRENPGPAMTWLVVGAVLCVLELGHWLGGILAIGSAIRFVLSGIASIPGWFGTNVADSYGPIVGALVADTVAIGILFVVASLLTWYVLPWRIIDRVGYASSRRVESYVERALVTVVLTIGAVLMAFTPVGSVVHTEIGATTTILEMLSSSLPTLTGRETIPNEGYRSPNGGWEGTFLGLSPAWAWAIRTILVVAYAFVLLVWLWTGYNTYRKYYRTVDWTPMDDTVRRFRNHYWGLFGLFIVVLFVVMAIWAPVVAPAPVEYNVYEQWTESAEFQYLDENGEVATVTHGQANIRSQSDGQNTVGPMTYDDFDRFAPLGTTHNGQDMLTNLAFGARTSLIIGLTAIGLGGALALVLSLITAYYKGVIDILTVVTTDTVIAIPAFLLVILLSVILGDHPVSQPLDGGLLLALIIGFAFAPGMWRAIRGPSLQVAEEEWVDAAKSYGQSPQSIMRKHMAPYIFIYLLIYASLLLGAVIIVVAALSFLGLGISSPTPEWGRMIDAGSTYVSTSSWHVATISGLMIVLLVTAFNALGDGIRDAIDPESDIGEDADAMAGGGG